MFLWRGQEQLLKRNSVWKRMFRKIKTFEASTFLYQNVLSNFFRFIVTTFLLLWYNTLCLIEALFPDIKPGNTNDESLEVWKWDQLCENSSRLAFPLCISFPCDCGSQTMKGKTTSLPYHQTNPHKQGLGIYMRELFFTNLLLLLIIWLTIVCFI